VTQSRSYDAGGRVVTRSLPLMNDALPYDAADRLLSGTTVIPATQATQALTFAYSGLPALHYAQGGASGVSYEEFKPDALGNRLWVRDPEVIDNVDRTRYHSIDAGTGQLTASALGTPTCGTSRGACPTDLCQRGCHGSRHG